MHPPPHVNVFFVFYQLPGTDCISHIDMSRTKTLGCSWEAGLFGSAFYQMVFSCSCCINTRWLNTEATEVVETLWTRFLITSLFWQENKRKKMFIRFSCFFQICIASVLSMWQTAVRLLNVCTKKPWLILRWHFSNL